MSTATTAFVRSVIAASTAAGSRFSVRGSTSAKTGVAPSKMKQLAEATNETGEVIASSPGPSPAIWQSRWRPAVPLESAAAYGAPTRSATSSSNRSIVGPSESRPERSTSRTSSSSRSPIHGRASGISCRAGVAGSRVCRAERRDKLATRKMRQHFSGLSFRWRALGVLEPLRPALAAPPHRIQVSRLQLERHRPDSELDVVDLPERRHLRGGAAHEGLVGEVEVGTDQALLDHSIAEILGDLDHSVARDPRQDRGREVGRVDDAVLDDEDVLAGPVGDISLRGQQNRLVIARPIRLRDREHRVQVDAGRLGDVRDHVRAYPLPARDLRADPVLQALLAEVGAPGPAHDHDVDRVADRGDAELAVAEEGNRTQVALREAVYSDQLVAGRTQLLDRV